MFSNSLREYVIESGRWLSAGVIIPIYEQVLLHSEALGASVAVEAVLVPPEFGFGFVTVTLTLGELCQLVLCGAEGSSLLSDTGGVNHQAVL